MRRDDWKLQLRAELAAADRRAWKWGEHDCCAFAARVAEEEHPRERHLALVVHQHEGPVVDERDLDAAALEELHREVFADAGDD